MASGPSFLPPGNTPPTLQPEHRCLPQDKSHYGDLCLRAPPLASGQYPSPPLVVWPPGPILFRAVVGTLPVPSAWHVPSTVARRLHEEAGDSFPCLDFMSGPEELLFQRE
ncbi:hypothetical protein TWF506_003155 [Arthrobotrys conoides]|uniref:Uncharacterized protein n=1 Tax=Arthrobotrys conoides TaxID=74498 RepID=A0AAN8NCA5_9PEZI